jgi:hypothetical protein
MTSQGYTVAVGAAPDENDRLYLMVEGPKGTHHAARVAQYLEHNAGAPPRSTAVLCSGVFASFPASVGLTAILRATSELLRGHKDALIFDRVEVNATEPTMGPGLYFRISPLTLADDK